MAFVETGKDNKIRLRKNSRPYQILKYLALGSGILLVSAVSPAAGAQLIKAGVKSYIRNRKFQKEKFLRDLKNLQKRELMGYRVLSDGKIEMALTKNGKEKILSCQLDDIQLKPQKEWDRKWRLVMFDIPQRYKPGRDALRHKLKELNFYPIQKSVYITPYPCEDEIDFIASVFNVRKYILIFYGSNFEGEEKLRYHFKV